MTTNANIVTLPDLVCSCGNDLLCAAQASGHDLDADAVHRLSEIVTPLCVQYAVHTSRRGPLHYQRMCRRVERRACQLVILEQARIREENVKAAAEGRVGFGFIFLAIAGAFLSWIVGKLLDRWFAWYRSRPTNDSICLGMAVSLPIGSASEWMDGDE